MKNRFLTVGLIAAMMVPAMAQAQTRELSRDRQEIRKEQRDVRQAQHHGNARDVRNERRDVRDARQDYRQDWKRDKRYTNWRAPFKYQRFAVGNRMNSRYYAPTYRLNYDARWRIPQAGRNMTYVRHYNDLLLINTRSGSVVKVYRSFF
jgi:Ni/Co efflux regulator RcnB